MLENNSLFIADENGQEVRMEILFTFENEEKKKNYVVFYDPSVDNEEVFASIYDDEGNLFPIDDEAEWSMVEEVIGAFQNDEENSAE